MVAGVFEKKYQGRIGELWQSWKHAAKAIGDFQARLILVAFYFVIAAPFALLVRAGDPLALKSGSARGWRARAGTWSGSLEDARKQF